MVILIVEKPAALTSYLICQKYMVSKEQNCLLICIPYTFSILHCGIILSFKYFRENRLNVLITELFTYSWLR